jgi:hypothetical protein
MTRRARLWAAAAVAGLGLGGLGLTLAQDTAPQPEPQGQNMSDTHQIGVKSGDSFVPLATLTFDSANTGTLKLGASHEMTPILVKVWTELARKGSVAITKSFRSDPSEGEDVAGREMVIVPKDSPDYRAAVLSFLEQEYGFVTGP